MVALQRIAIWDSSANNFLVVHHVTVVDLMYEVHFVCGMIKERASPVMLSMQPCKNIVHIQV